MMAQGNTSEGFSKSRPVLGDLTNRLGKREFSGGGIRSFSSNDIAKRTRVSPSPCTEINSLKGSVVSSIAEVSNENREPNVQDLRSGFVVFDRLIDVESDCDEGKDALMGNLEVHGRNKDIDILDLSGGIDVSRSVNELNVGNDLVDGCGDRGMFKGDEVASLNCKGPNSTDLEAGRALNSVATEAVYCRKLDLLKENKLSGIAETVSKPNFANLNCAVIGNVVNIMINSDDGVTLDSSNALHPVSINEANQGLGDSFLAATSRTVSETGGDCLNENKDFDFDELKASLEGSQINTDDNQNNEYDHKADNLGNQCDCVILPQSQESSVFGVERSTELKKVHERDSMNGGADSIKACTCSFCTKAAYILLDLNYQDIKARVSAMKKSRKEASILAERSIRSKVIEKNGNENFTTVSKLESDLMYQWRSLFQHMADICQEEANQLEAQLLPLAELKEKCKTDMESINATLSGNR